MIDALAKYLNYDGILKYKDETVLSIPQIHAWSYYATIEIRYTQESLLFAKEAWSELIRKTGTLGIEIPTLLQTQQRLEREVIRTVTQNDEEEGILRVSIYPDQHYSIELFLVKTKFWELKKEGGWTKVLKYPDIINLPYWYRHNNVWPTYKKIHLETGYNTILVQDDHDLIVESTDGGFFFIEKKKVFYVGKPLYTNAISHYVIENYNTNGKVEVLSSVTSERIHKADELFILDNAHGLRWILAMDQRRYFSITSKNIYQWLYQQFSENQTV
ncbi:hypothetical protein K4L44_00795 [Halosquirtibacter laminarini]|uniref:Uncharacterized protein n=1 Tax=Halosquirtibacter laminarini TaxID=3374600 RepID=A0AC61NFU4_9BACT|nr:hypothetical protein K4L44_00795 [Prolixibacteraceae bacterium]